MRDYYSVQSLYNPVSRPVTSRFPDHLSAVCETATGPSNNGHHNHGSSCHLFDAPLRRPLPKRKGCSTPRVLPRELQLPHHPSSTHRAAV